MAVSVEEIKKLREKTGAGVMDCKQALIDAKGSFEKAVEILRKKGLATARKRMQKQTKEGVIQAYIHPGNRLGVLVEINCETDFVARTEEFREFAKNIAMQIAASNPLVISRDQLPKEDIERELNFYREQSRDEGKPEEVVERIAQGKLGKYLQEVCLLEQSYIKDPTKNVNDLLMETIAKLGENITIRRFVRFQLGEE